MRRCNCDTLVVEEIVAYCWLQVKRSERTVSHVYYRADV